jgi:beta-RFAP synthase
LAVARALHAWHEKPDPTANELARLTGRGHRSAVGTHGFVHGGLIVEAGKLPEEMLGPLSRRVALPSRWRIVLVRARESAGLHGDVERRAFASLPPVGDETRELLQDEVQNHILPAVADEDCTAFGEAVYRFGYRAGACFATIQGGPFQNARVARLVDEIRCLGIPGVGQSSWGPTLFCIAPDQAAADNLAVEIGRRHNDEDLDVSITSPDNRGADMDVE